MVYFMCWIPYYIVTLIEGNESTVAFNVNMLDFVHEFLHESTYLCTVL